MSGLLDGILNLSGAAAYILVGLLAFGEAAAFIGLILPGELAVLLGGVVVSNGNASLPIMIAVACGAAIAGDSVGYEIGRHFGPRIVAWPPFARRFGAKLDRAADYLQEKGGRAVFWGRWTSLLRALVPGLAGMARMPYGRFLAFNIVGGTAWATTFVLLGYLAGASWRQVERIAGQASLLLLALVVLGLGLRWATRRLVARADAVHQRLDALANTAPLRWVRVRFAAPLAWMRARTTPGASRGLGWTLSVAVAGAAAWVVGIAVQDLLAKEELALLDGPVAAWITAHTTATATAVAEVVADVFGAPLGVWAVLVLAVLAWRLCDRAAGVRVGIAAALAAGLAFALQAVLPVTVGGSRFPAESVTWLTAALVAALPAVGGRDLRAGIRLAGAGTGILVLAGAAELVAGDAGLSGVVGGFGIGALIGIGGELSARIVGSSQPAPAQ